MTDVVDDERLLVGEDPAGGGLVEGQFHAWDFTSVGGEDVEAHAILGGVVEDERHEIEGEDGAELGGEAVEERLEVAVLEDSGGDFEEGLESFLVHYGFRIAEAAGWSGSLGYAYFSGVDKHRRA